MANSLKKNIKEGESVLWDNKEFVCTGGFGMCEFTMGNAIMGYFKDEPTKMFRISGFDIKAFPTTVE